MTFDDDDHSRAVQMDCGCGRWWSLSLPVVAAGRLKLKSFLLASMGEAYKPERRFNTFFKKFIVPIL